MRISDWSSDVCSSDLNGAVRPSRGTDMLHLFMGKGPWFRQKSRGYGTGFPIVWQGWVLLSAHIALIAGLAVLLQGRPVLMTIAVIFAALAPMPIYRARTEGGWRSEERRVGKACVSTCRSWGST